MSLNGISNKSIYLTTDKKLAKVYANSAKGLNKFEYTVLFEINFDDLDEEHINADDHYIIKNVEKGFIEFLDKNFKSDNKTLLDLLDKNIFIESDIFPSGYKNSKRYFNFKEDDSRIRDSLYIINNKLINVWQLLDFLMLKNSIDDLSFLKEHAISFSKEYNNLLKKFHPNFEGSLLSDKCISYSKNINSDIITLIECYVKENLIEYKKGEICIDKCNYNDEFY